MLDGKQVSLYQISASSGCPFQIYTGKTSLALMARKAWAGHFRVECCSHSPFRIQTSTLKHFTPHTGNRLQGNLLKPCNGTGESVFTLHFLRSWSWKFYNQIEIQMYYFSWDSRIWLIKLWICVFWVKIPGTALGKNSNKLHSSREWVPKCQCGINHTCICVEFDSPD